MPMIVNSRRKMEVDILRDFDEAAWFAVAEFDPGHGPHIFKFVGPNARTQRGARRRLFKQMFKMK